MPLATNKTRYLGTAALLCALTAVNASILLLGCVHAHFLVPMCGLSLLALVLHVADRWMSKRRMGISWIGLPIALGVVFTWTTLIPVSPAVFRWAFPHQSELLAQVSAILSPGARHLMSSALSLDPPETAGHLVALCSALALFLVISDRARERSARIFLYWGLLAGAMLLFITATGHQFLNVGKIWGVFETSIRPFYAPLVNPNNLARAFGLYALVCFAGALTMKATLARTCFGIGGVLCGLGVYLTLSRGAILVFSFVLVGTVIISLLPNGKLRLPIWAGAGAVAVGILALFVSQQAIVERLESVKTELSSPSKTLVYVPAWNVIKQSWPTGIGPYSFEVASSMVSPLNREAKLLPLSSLDTYYVENDFIQLFVDYGVFKGLVLLAAAIAAAVFVIRRWQLLGPAQLLAVALFFVVVADLFDFALEIPGLLWLAVIILGMIAGALSQKEQGALKLKSIVYLPLSALIVLISVWFSATIWTQNRYDFSKELYALTPASPKYQPLLQQAIAAHPFNKLFTYWMADSLIRQGNLVEALKWSQLTTQIAPTTALGYLSSARILWDLHRIPESLDNYRKTWIADPDYAITVVKEVSNLTSDQSLRRQVLIEDSAANEALLCKQLVDEKHLDLAQTCYDRLIALKRASDAQIQAAIELALKRDDVVGAVRYLQPILDNGLPDGEMAVLAAKVIALGSTTMDALLASDSWLKRAKNPTPLLVWQFNSYLDTRQYASAKQSLDALRARGYGDSSSRGLAIMEARLLQEKGELARALQSVRSLTELYPSDVDILDWRRSLAEKLSLYDEAVATCQQELVIYPKDKRLSDIRARLEQKRNEHRQRLLGTRF